MNESDSLSGSTDGDTNFIQVWAASVLVLLGLTWRLWLPGFTTFPRAPLFLADEKLLLLLHYFATALFVVSLAALVIGVHQRKRWLAIVAFALPVTFLCNQHCLQPWAWQTFILATLMACLGSADSKRWIRWLLISIYFYSALGKFDYQFLETVGQQFLYVPLSWVGAASILESSLVSDWLVLLFPVGELLIAVGLFFARTRRAAAWMAILLHIALIVILSPVGLNHRLPVLIWNGLSIVLVVWMFLSSEHDSGSVVNRSKSVFQRFATVFALVVLFGPLLRPVEFWDHWLAWGLYSPGNSRVEIMVPETAFERVDQELRPYLKEESTFGVLEFSMSQWSLEELGVPIYPQARVQKVIASQIIREQGLGTFARVTEYSQSHPVSGIRVKTEIDLGE